MVAMSVCLATLTREDNRTLSGLDPLNAESWIVSNDSNRCLPKASKSCAWSALPAVAMVQLDITPSEKVTMFRLCE